MNPNRFFLPLALLLSFTLGCASTGPAAKTDPYLWLEEIEGEKALDWVRAQNKLSVAAFESDERFAGFKKQAEDILQAKDRIPYGSYRGGYVYNFWRDAENVRGLWRRATLSEYRKKEPVWEVLLDLDALAAEENENWVYKGGGCLAPEYRLCMVKLSRGGKDAVVVREFDVGKKAFVDDGFLIPEGKTSTAWIDNDTLFVGADFGPGTLTDSGYPRLTKRWKRGTPISEAETVFEGKKKDVGVWAWRSSRPEGRLTIIERFLSFFEAEYWILRDDGTKVLIPIPRGAKSVKPFQGRLLMLLRSDWRRPEGVFKAGSLVAVPLAPILKNGSIASVKTVFAPDSRTSVRRFSTARSALFVDVLREVKGEILRFELSPNGEWSSRRVPLPKNGTLSLRSVESYEDIILASYTGFLTPTRLYLIEPRKRPVVVKSLPPRFDAGGLIVEQKSARSKDGTVIPYFLVRREDMEFDGSNPTLLYGYGGFEVSMLPYYSSSRGKLWLENGGSFVLANIRGGGEFGPRWHQAALKEKRQKGFDDFIAVAEDLVRTKAASPEHLGIMGRSNGGLLVGAVFVQRPDLFNAVVCQVPLLDMLRYSKLLVGASWMGEYGDPDDPKMRRVIKTYSPYQNVRKDRKYPPVFFHTSTKDDRVHPGHARKMVAKMRGFGHPVFYFENIEGGHSAAANLLQRARIYAMEYVYLFQRLAD